MIYTNKIWNKVVILPSHPGVNKMQQNKIIDLINKVKNYMFFKSVYSWVEVNVPIPKKLKCI